MKLRYAFDLGTNSIGWTVYELGNRVTSLGHKELNVPIRLVDMGVNLFRDGRKPKTGESLSALRRIPRGARRRRDRFLQRRTYLLLLLEKFNLIPPIGPDRDQLMQSNPYPLRAIAPNEEVSLHALGRVLFHLNQRRGFKSNRKATTAEDENESGKIASAAARLHSQLHDSGFTTLGQYLAHRQVSAEPRDRRPVRIRLNGAGAKAQYEFYPLREMLEHEFDVIWAQQAIHHTQLTKALRNKIRNAIFFQRPLAPVEPGRCTFFPEESRLSDATELAQAFRIFQMVNNLRVIHQQTERDLSKEERDRLTDALMLGEDLTWTKVRRRLGLDLSNQLNLEQGGEKLIKGNAIARVMEGTSAKKPGPLRGIWNSMPESKKTALLKILTSAEEDAEVKHWALQELQLSEIAATSLARIRLPDTYRRLGERAVNMIVAELKSNVITYSEAVARIGLHHSALGGDEHYNVLPPYNRIPSLHRFLGRSTGDPKDSPDVRFGRLTNPTVHIGLNQLRRTTNALIDRFGSPTQIVIELARELKQSEKQKQKTRQNINENREANDRRRDILIELGHINEGQRRIGGDLLRLRLWEELGDEPRRCPYTGKVISITRLLSAEIEIEHILPFSRTLDNSPANKTVSFREANRLKTNLSPTEAAERHPDFFNLTQMQQRVALSRMPGNKRWRFNDDAMERFDNEEDFLARQLNETQYLSRVARAYLSTLFPRIDETGKGRQHVWVVPGRLTALLRARLGINLGDHNRKSRNDHRHHAIDAAVIGIIDRSLIQRISAISARQEQEGVDRLLADLEEPYVGFRSEIQQRIESVLVNSRAKHTDADHTDSSRTTGKLHEETYYGLVRDVPENEHDLSIGNVVRRKPVVDLTVKEICMVRDDQLRTSIQLVTEVDSTTHKSPLSKKQIAERLVQWSIKQNVSRVRVLKNESAVLPIKSTVTGKNYKFVVPEENLFIDIYESADGRWIGIGVDSFTANRIGSASVENNANKFIMRAHKGDFIQLIDIDTGQNIVKKVHQLKAKSRLLVLAAANEAGELQKRHDDKDDMFRWDFATISKLSERRARRVRFTAAGRMKTVPHGKI